MRIISVPAELYYRERINRERARPVAEAIFGKMMASLTRPVTDAERSPDPMHKGTGILTISADSMDQAIEDFNQLFLDNMWSDGLPLIAPTRERVEWMLTGTSRKPGEVIGTIAPRNGTATIEKIAINAVMAGARPEYLPVIIAAVEALADPQFDDLHFATSTGSFNLLISVSGPIAEEIGMNAGLGMFSYGSRANGTIGRAVRLAVINFGHTWPAMNDMALIGRPNPFSFITFAENQAQSPWTPYRESQGFAGSDSTVTLTVTGGYGGSPTRVYGGGAVALVPPETILERMARDMTEVRGGVLAADASSGILAGNENAVRSNYRRYFVIFNPEVAQELHDRLGYNRETVQEYLFEAASIPYEDLSERDIDAVKRAVDTGYVPSARAPRILDGLKPGGTVPMLSRPDDIHVIVAGGIPGYTMMMSYFRGGIYKPESNITRKITGAVLTRAGNDR